MKSQKSLIYNACLNRVQQMVQTAELSLTRASEAANSETKSSVGDKFETGRAMAHAEMHKAERQLGEAKVLLTQLKLIDIQKVSDRIEIGSLVETNRGIFFLSIGLGKLHIEEDTIFVLGVQSPIGKLLLHKQIQSSFDFNGNNFIIQKIS